MKWLKRRTCRKAGHIWGPFVADTQREAEYPASKIAGWDFFKSSCEHCGDERDLKQHHSVTEMMGVPR